MKNIAVIVILSAIAGSIFSQNLGIGEASPGQKLDVLGWVKVGNESAGTTASTGAIRYHSSGKLQFYNGSAWVNLPPDARTNFTNWGRNDCPATSTRVYPGFAAGGHAGHSGSGAATICLTNAPSWMAGSFNDGNHNGALLYGVEMLTSGYGIASLVPFHGYDMLCAVCEVTGANETLMMPGTTNCPSGWTKQYEGYLMANHYTQRMGEYVCANATPMTNGSNVNTGGQYWYPTETEMSSLVQGAPYVQDREVTCCICTR